MAIQDEILEVLKLRLLPEIQEIKQTQVQFDKRLTDLQAGVTVLAGRLDAVEQRMEERFELIDKRFEQVDKRFEQVDKRFEQVDKRFEQVETRLRELHEDVREMRSYMFTSKMHGSPYQVREDRPGKA